jgi:hypothetical protein
VIILKGTQLSFGCVSSEMLVQKTTIKTTVELLCHLLNEIKLGKSVK